MALAAASPDSRGSSLHPETGLVSIPAQVRAAGQACEGARLLSNRSAPEPAAHMGASLREVVEPPAPTWNAMASRGVSVARGLV